MRFIFIIVLAVFLLPASVFAYSADVKGFVALDLLDYSKHADQQGKLTTGIGVLDLKVYGRHNNFASKLKLDIDGSLSYNNSNKLFEEMTVRYYFNNFVNLTVGKGKVPFHRMHWGVVQHNFMDSGSIIWNDKVYDPNALTYTHKTSANAKYQQNYLEMRNNIYWRDQDRRTLATLRLGNYFNTQFFNHTTIYGNEQQVIGYDDDGDPETVYDRTYNLEDGFGIANKFEYFGFPDFALSISGNYFKTDYAPKASWAFDLGGKYKDTDIEIWWEALYGFASRNYGISYSPRKQYEQNYQLGAEYNYSDLIGILANVEASFVNRLEHDIDGNNYYNGNTKLIDSHKYEAGIKLKYTRSAFVTIGAVYETRSMETNSTVDGNMHKFETSAYALQSGLAFWY